VPLIANSETRLNAAVIDEWSLVHVSMGALAAALGMSGWTFVTLATAYEVVEFLHESPRGSWIFGSKRPEWDVNMVSDLAVAFGAYALTAWALRKPPVEE
jgi:hypothetical protein